MGFTVTQRNAILNQFFRNTAPTTYATLYCSLHTADPTDSGTSEVTGGSYARQTVAFDAASSGATQNTGALSFTGMPACTVTHFGIWSANTSGVLICYAGLSANKTPAAGDTISIAIGDLDWTTT